MKRLTTILLILLLLGTIFSARSQDDNEMGNQKLTIYLNDEKSHWFKFGTYFQVWGRATQNNPGTTVFGKLEETTTDISIRRFRLAFQAQPTDKLYAYFQLGVNNLKYLSPRGTQTELLDAHVDYSFSKHFSIGGGKSAWDGLSRYTSPSASKHMSYDLPFLALPTVNATDDLIRKLSIYVKGKLGRVDYRMVVSKPFSVQNNSRFDPVLEENIAKFADNPSGQQYAGYFKYEFWDRESNRTPFQVGTYQGKKKVLNLGAGFYFQSDALWNLNLGDTVFNDMVLGAVDFFMDLPLNPSRKTALTVYAAYFNYDFGPNYVRNIGANNPANGVDPDLDSFNGTGNAFPIAGTGNSGFFQAGYLLPPLSKSRNFGQLQPYATFQLSDFERLDDLMFYYDLGINWLLNGHLSKFALNFQNRPIFFETTQGITQEDRKWMVVLQYQVRIE